MNFWKIPWMCRMLASFRVSAMWLAIGKFTLEDPGHLNRRAAVTFQSSCSQAALHISVFCPNGQQQGFSFSVESEHLPTGCWGNQGEVGCDRLMWTCVRKGVFDDSDLAKRMRGLRCKGGESHGPVLKSGIRMASYGHTPQE